MQLPQRETPDEIFNMTLTSLYAAYRQYGKTACIGAIRRIEEFFTCDLDASWTEPVEELKRFLRFVNQADSGPPAVSFRDDKEKRFVITNMAALLDCLLTDSSNVLKYRNYMSLAGFDAKVVEPDLTQTRLYDTKAKQAHQIQGMWHARTRPNIDLASIEEICVDDGYLLVVLRDVAHWDIYITSYDEEMKRSDELAQVLSAHAPDFEMYGPFWIYTLVYYDYRMIHVSSVSIDFCTAKQPWLNLVQSPEFMTSLLTKLWASDYFNAFHTIRSPLLWIKWPHSEPLDPQMRVIELKNRAMYEKQVVDVNGRSQEQLVIKIDVWNKINAVGPNLRLAHLNYCALKLGDEYFFAAPRQRGFLVQVCVQPDSGLLIPDSYKKRGPGDLLFYNFPVLDFHMNLDSHDQQQLGQKAYFAKVADHHKLMDRQLRGDSELHAMELLAMMDREKESSKPHAEKKPKKKEKRKAKEIEAKKRVEQTRRDIETRESDAEGEDGGEKRKQKELEREERRMVAESQARRDAANDAAERVALQQSLADSQEDENQRMKRLIQSLIAAAQKTGDLEHEKERMKRLIDALQKERDAHGITRAKFEQEQKAHEDCQKTLLSELERQRMDLSNMAGRNDTLRKRYDEHLATLRESLDKEQQRRLNTEKELLQMITNQLEYYLTQNHMKLEPNMLSVTSVLADGRMVKNFIKLFRTLKNTTSSERDVLYEAISGSNTMRIVEHKTGMPGIQYI